MNDPKVFKLASCRWYDFGDKRSKVKVRVRIRLAKIY